MKGGPRRDGRFPASEVVAKSRTPGRRPRTGHPTRSATAGRLGLAPPPDGSADRRKDWISEPSSFRRRSRSQARSSSCSAPSPLAAAQTPARGKAAFLNHQAPVCQSGRVAVRRRLQRQPVAATYVGHDEPSVAVQVRRPRLGQRHHLHRSRCPPSRRSSRATTAPDGATWNFQLRPTFWFGLTLCDTESAPEFTKTCTPDSDANDLVGTDPTRAGLHRQAPRQRVHGAAVLRPGLRAAVRGLRLRPRRSTAPR